MLQGFYVAASKQPGNIPFFQLFTFLLSVDRRPERMNSDWLLNVLSENYFGLHTQDDF